MKTKLFLIVCLLLSGILPSRSRSLSPATGYLPPRVDLSVETVSIAAMLAGYHEYNMIQDPAYKQELLDHFTPHKNHPLIEYTRRMQEEFGIGYNAVAAMGVHLTPPPAFEPRVPFSFETPEYRWTEEAATEFVRLLRDFYVAADCATFFRQQEAYYREAEEVVRSIFEKLDVE